MRQLLTFAKAITHLRVYLEEEIDGTVRYYAERDGERLRIA